MILSPSLSVIIPAFNEEKFLGHTIEAARKSLEKAGILDYEIIVADDASTDGTVEIARTHGARVVVSGKRNIGGTRNVGAAVAGKEYLLFLDADTHFGVETAVALRRAMENNQLGGGSILRWSETAPFHARVGVRIWNLISRVKHWPCGAFFFVKRDVFEKVGGFDESYYASEEIHLARSLSQYGRLVIFNEGIESSPRKFGHFGLRDIGIFFFHLFRAPRATLKSKRYLDFWYTRKD